MKYNYDWSKSHNGVMLCSFAKTKELMPEVTPILEALEPQLEMDIDKYLVDVKIHMLMPKQFPCIPNWHYDFMPRDCEGERTAGKASKESMYMWISGAPLTQYKKGGNVYTKPAQQWNTFTQRDLHRGSMAEEHTWRCFIRVIPKEFVHETTINAGQIRRHTQVYCDSETFKW